MQRSLTHNNPLLLLSELPHAVRLLHTNFFITLGDSLVGFLTSRRDITGGFLMSLNDALTTTLTLYNHCFITFGASTFAVMKENLFYVFDSHSRGRDGTQVP